MAVTSWRTKHQNIRSGKIRQSKHRLEEALVDLNDDPRDNIKTILKNLSSLGTIDSTLVNYLNVFVKVILKIEGKFEDHGYDVGDILACLRLTLFNLSSKVRSGSLRCIRHVLRSEDDVICLNKFLIPFLITRSLDFLYKQDGERLEAMKLMRKILILSPANFDACMARSLVALANEGTESKDRMLRSCLATLSELGVLNPKLFIQSGGVAAITRNLLECQTPKIAEALCGVLLLMLDKPETRDTAGVDLHTLAAPFCDFHYKLCLKENKKYEVNERELRLNCSRLSLLTVLRSWSGILHFCGPNDQSGFKAVVDVLYLDQLEVRKAVLDLLYELLGLPQPEWSDELSVALGAIDPCEPQASWRLTEDFVAAEGKSVLPHLSKTTPSLTEMHLSLLLYCFLENGLLNALTEVIATSDTFISVRATVLLGELLRLIQVLLPPDCCNVSPALPLLIDYAIKNVPQAIGAITALQQLHKLLKRRPASYSIYLDYIIKSNSTTAGQTHRPSKTGSIQKLTSGLKSKIHQLQGVLRDGEHTVKDTGVLVSTDPFTWNWDLVTILLRGENNFRFDLTDSSHKAFIKRLVEFFMPSKNKYSHLDLQSSQQNTEYTQCGVQLIHVLIELLDKDTDNFLLEFFKDIFNNVTAITSGKTVHDCLFSPQHMINTQCQSYFLFIGRFATTKTGIDMLTTIDMFNKLEELATTTNHEVYVKLIVSCLDYGSPGPSRKILQSILTCGQENSRLYATQFLLVPLRAGASNFSTWGIELLVDQLKDKSKAVCLAALNTLHEACELPECLESLIRSTPHLNVSIERDMLLWIRFLSTKIGIRTIDVKQILNMLKHWDKHYIYRYVKLTEGNLADALTLHQRGLDGKYDKRTSSITSTCHKNVFLSPHIYGQLNQHKEGLEILIEHGNCDGYIKTIIDAECSTDDEILELKAAIWSMGHLATSNEGFIKIHSKGIIDALIELAQFSPVYSVRATSFYSLGLVATTKLGADQLFQKGWVCTRHHRHDFWPIIEDEEESIAKSLLRQRNNNSISEEGSVSMENPFTCDFESIDEDTGDDSFSIAKSPDIRRTGVVKQSTLPAGRRPQNIFHKRSYSESKTFDINGYTEERSTSVFERSQFGRIRNNSVTESTTSGVSSCDSLQGLKNANAIVEHTQTLSPIPSSSSLSTLQFTTVTQRSHKNSESSHRMSSQSDTNSEYSTVSNFMAFNKRSYQDWVGYHTLRYLRTSPNIDEDWTSDPSTKYIPNYPLQGSPSLLEDFKMMDISLKSVFNDQKFPLNSFHSKYEDKIYLGITLPQTLCDLFPKKVIPTAPLVLSQLVEEANSSLNEDVSVQSVGSQNSKNYNQLMTHTPERCFHCSSRIGTSAVLNLNEKQDAYDVLHNVERLSNPLWNKHVRQVMLQYRHRNAAILKDLCIYSEVCKMLTENTFRVLSRRILHELFLELNTKSLYEDYQQVFDTKICSEKKEEHLTEGCTDRKSSLVQSHPTTLPIGSPQLPRTVHTSPTLDSLHLIYKENKFPIRENK